MTTLGALALVGGTTAGEAQVAAPSGTGTAVPVGPPRAPGRPAIRSVTCRTACRALGTATRGSVVRVAGDGLDAVSRIAFHTAGGAHADGVAGATPAGSNAVDVRVPPSARTGPLVAMTVGARRSPASRSGLVLLGRPLTSPQDPRVETRVAPAAGPPAAARPVDLALLVRARHTVQVAVDLRRARGRVVERWALGALPDGTVQDVVWDGRVGGAPAPEGRYLFQVSATQLRAGPRTALPLREVVRDAGFVVSRGVFPVRGPHRLDGGAATFGGARHHRGQDVAARCGTPIVAAIGGRVRQAAYDAGGGNYVVVADADGRAQVYMHLAAPARVATGDRVAAGQPLGRVGETGDARGCHLHFESWTGPGWYAGGHPVDPLAALRLWDHG